MRRCKQGNRERVEVKLFEDVVDRIRPSAVLVDAIKRVTGGLHRQRREFENFTIGRDSTNARCYAQAGVVGLARLLDHSINLLSTCSLWVENRFGVV